MMTKVLENKKLSLSDSNEKLECHNSSNLTLTIHEKEMLYLGQACEKYNKIRRRAWDENKFIYVSSKEDSENNLGFILTLDEEDLKAKDWCAYNEEDQCDFPIGTEIEIEKLGKVEVIIKGSSWVRINIKK